MSSTCYPTRSRSLTLSPSSVYLRKILRAGTHLMTFPRHSSPGSKLSTLQAIDDAVERFHRYRKAFRLIRPDGFSLLRQHAMVHYHPRIEDFAVPNGLCSSITESKHIRAVKRPYRRSNRNQPLGQMLLTNQLLDKLSTARADFTTRGMMEGSLFKPPLPALEVPLDVASDAGDKDVDGDGEFAGANLHG
uniref:Uncharacterized protein n=1 Tax=Mycena chlorophos TaxID=658473 RepID=A0ABQ0L025_MYCCL|nr:predicted protein [Mycena chlorophos]